MLMKHFIVYFGIVSLLAVPLLGQQCGATSGCNQNSYCDTSSGYCSCLSGFSGNDCSIQPQSSCASSYKTPSSEDPLDSSVTSSLNENTLNVLINARLENNRYVDSSATPLVDSNSNIYSLGTTINWSTDSTDCDYPSSNHWTKNAVTGGSCLDSYSLSMNWNDAKTGCGFVYDPNTNSWSSNLTINRYYAHDTTVIIEGQKRDEPLIVEGNDELGSDFEIHKKDAPGVLLIMDGSQKRDELPLIMDGQKRDDLPLIMDGQKRDDTAPLIQGRSVHYRFVSATFTVTIQDNSLTEENAAQEDEVMAASGVDAEVAPAYSSKKDKLVHLNDWQIAVAAVAAVFGVLFIVTIALVVVIRRRNARKAQAEFNFAGIDSD